MRYLDKGDIINVIGDILTNVLDVSGDITYKIYVDKRELIQLLCSDTKRLLPILIESIPKNKELSTTVNFGKINMSKKTYETKMVNLEDTKFDTKYFRQFEQIDVQIRYRDNRSTTNKVCSIIGDLFAFAINTIDNL